jgi:hypothetical protein
MRAFSTPLRSALTTLLLASGLSLAACGGSGNTFGNGSGSVTSATAANQVAGIDIANGNYSAAISVLSPFCPSNNCQTADIANTLANAYMAMGNTSTGASVTGVAPVTGASGGGATVTQILENALALVNNGSNTSTNAIIQTIFQAVPCVSSNTCTATYLDNLATAIQVLDNPAFCSAYSAAVASTGCPNSSTMIIADMVYILAATQYDTGITYTGGKFQVCDKNGGGLTGCSPTLSLSSTSFASTQLDNIGAILDNINLGTNPNITINNATMVNVVQFFAASLSSNSSNLTPPIYQFLNSIQCYGTNLTNGTSTTNCPPSVSSQSPPTSLSLTSTQLGNGLAGILNQL